MLLTARIGRLTMPHAVRAKPDKIERLLLIKVLTKWSVRRLPDAIVTDSTFSGRGPFTVMEISLGSVRSKVPNRQRDSDPTSEEEEATGRMLIESPSVVLIRTVVPSGSPTGWLKNSPSNNVLLWCDKLYVPLSRRTFSIVPGTRNLMDPFPDIRTTPTGRTTPSIRTPTTMSPIPTMSFLNYPSEVVSRG